MTTILHVEDDPLLPELVRDTFEAFGFRGTFLVAETVAQAREIIASHPTLDLVISDMQLPDGTGLDVVCSLRSQFGRAYTPVLILSGEADPENVNRAYALGANSYVTKTARDRDRSVGQTMKTLFEHWLKDARLPMPSREARTRAWLAREARIRSRSAHLCMALSEQLGPDTTEATFWMDIALREGNVANLLSFLLEKLGDRELPSTILDEVEARQAVDARVVAEFEEHPVCTKEDVQRYLRRYVPDLDPMPFARAVSQLFPVVSVANVTLRDVACRSLEDLAAWLETNASDQTLRGQIPILREKAAHVRSSMAAMSCAPPE